MLVELSHIIEEGMLTYPGTSPHRGFGEQSGAGVCECPLIRQLLPYDAGSMDGWTVAVDDPRKPDIVALLERHLRFARSVTPPEDVHALDLDGLLTPDVTFFSLRDAGLLLGIGAMRHLGNEHIELKSIHTAEEWRGRGVGRAVVQHLVEEARQRGAVRVSLETGSMDAFAPSRALYARLGFVECEPFAGYDPSRSSTFMTLELR